MSIEALEKAVDEIEAQIQNSLDREVTSLRIGEFAMEKLKEIDEVAYVRFASVYRSFKDINSFREEINQLLLMRNRRYFGVCSLRKKYPLRSGNCG